MKKIEAMMIYNCKCAKCNKELKANKEAHFHHLRSYNKKYNMSTMFDKYSSERTMEELKKTVLLCATCHKALHHELGLKVFKKDSLAFINA